MSIPVEFIFTADILLLFVLLTGVVWSLVSPGRRIWPPPGEGSWQHWLTWALFYLVFMLNAFLLILDWNSWIFAGSLRFVLGIPLILLGTLLLLWGVKSLGARNTSGLQDGFVSSGSYQFTRNPQYLGDIVLFIGLSLVANSLYLWIAHVFTILVFIIAPLAEESWLAEQYGDRYFHYKRDTPRFL